MRILEVIPSFSDSFGGPVTVVRSLSKELAKRHDVTVYTTTALDPRHDFDPREEQVNGYKITYFKRTLKPLCYSGIFGQLNLSSSMMKAVKGNLSEFDLVHVHSWQQFPDVMVHHHATKYHVPYVLQVHGSLPRIIAKQKLKWVFDIFFGYKLLRDASEVIALTQTEAQQYRNMGVPDEKIATIPNGIDLTLYSDLPPKGSFKKKFGIDDNERIVLYLGRVHRSKGIDFLVRSFAYLINNGTEKSKLVIAGPDDGYSVEVKTLVNSLGISDLVLFTGILPEEDKISAYVDSEICAYLGPFEPFGIVALEALACGTPVIVSRGTPMARVVDEEQLGFSVKYGDMYELAQTMGRMLNNKDMSSELGQNGRKFVFENFNWTSLAIKFEKVYEDVVKRSQ